MSQNLRFLDEIDSGLDIDALRIVSQSILKAKEETNVGLLIISHYGRFYDLIKPSHVHVLMNGRVVKSGGKDLADRIDSEGYEILAKELNINLVEEKKEREVVLLENCAHSPVKNNA